MPRPGLMALVLVVVAMHAAVLWLMLVASQPHIGRIGTAKRIAMEVVLVAPVRKAEPPAAPAAALRTAPTAVAPRASNRRAPPATRSNAITASPSAPAASVTPTAPPQAADPAPLILNSEATRRALRDLARQRSFAERANQDIGAPASSAFESRLGAGVAGAARGDCMKGQFKGNSMGLLSLPALALAAATGECAR